MDFSENELQIEETTSREKCLEFSRQGLNRTYVRFSINRFHTPPAENITAQLRLLFVF